MDICKQPLEKKIHPASLFFHVWLAIQSFYSSFPVTPVGFFSVTASSASTFYSCKWMITLPSHLRRTSSGKALLSLNREFCSEAVSEYFFPSLLSLLHNCFDWIMCSEVSPGAGLGLVWPTSGFTRNKGKTSSECFHPCKYLQGWENIFLFFN